MKLIVPRLNCKLVLLTGALLICAISWAQTKQLRGRVVNDFTKETVPFASIYWKKAGFGLNSDSAGQFRIRLSPFPVDTLVLSYVGFADVYKIIRSSQVTDTLLVEMVLRELKHSGNVEVKSKFNKGLRWWKAIVANKSRNNPYKYRIIPTSSITKWSWIWPT